VPAPPLPFAAPLCCYRCFLTRAACQVRWWTAFVKTGKLRAASPRDGERCGAPLGRTSRARRAGEATAGGRWRFR